MTEHCSSTFEDRLLEYWVSNWPKNIDRSNLKSNKVIFCPKNKSFTGIITSCFGCQYGYNASCYSIKEVLADNPGILKEIYAPVMVLTKEDKINRKSVSSGFCNGSAEGMVYLERYSSEIRFIPKYPDVRSEISGRYYNKNKNKIGTFKEISEITNTGDTIFLLEEE